jgi:hypothetical protein
MRYIPERYWERNSRAPSCPFFPPGVRGSQTAWTTTFSFSPGPTETFFAVACPRIVPLLRSLRSKYGTVAEYRVGFVKFIFACRVNVVFVVSKISREPTLGEKEPNPLEIAAKTVSFHDIDSVG